MTLYQTLVLLVAILAVASLGLLLARAERRRAREIRRDPSRQHPHPPRR